MMLMVVAGRGADAQERPRYGGEFVCVVPTEPAETSSVGPLAPGGASKQM